MARLSLRILLVAPALTACFDAPPEYSVPKPVPPVVLTSLVLPVTTAPWTADTASDIEFKVPFRSDDQGEDLEAFFIWDIPPSTGAADFTHVADSVGELDDSDLSPSDLPFADQGNTRAVHYTWAAVKWVARPGVGCHSMTMILSHRINFAHAYDLKEPLAAAQVTWFLGLGGAASTCYIVAGTTAQ